MFLVLQLGLRCLGQCKAGSKANRFLIGVEKDVCRRCKGKRDCRLSYCGLGLRFLGKMTTRMH